MFGLFRKSKALYWDEELELRLQQAGQYDRECGIRDGYTFDIYRRNGAHAVGYVSLRLGESPALYYLGHIGYRVYQGFRGRGYAARAVRLMMPLMRQEGLLHPVITTDTDNMPSRRTCENLGCTLEWIAPVPKAHREVCMGSRFKCRYILPLPGKDEEQAD